MVHKPVIDDPMSDTDQPVGGWVTIIHDCVTPTLQQIIAAQATFGTTWRCTCNSVWKLDMSRQAKSNASIVAGARIIAGDTGEAGIRHPEVTDLRWIRIKTNGEEED